METSPLSQSANFQNSKLYIVFNNQTGHALIERWMSCWKIFFGNDVPPAFSAFKMSVAHPSYKQRSSASTAQAVLPQHLHCAMITSILLLMHERGNYIFCSEWYMVANYLCLRVCRSSSLTFYVIDKLQELKEISEATLSSRRQDVSMRLNGHIPWGRWGGLVTIFENCPNRHLKGSNQGKLLLFQLLYGVRFVSTVHVSPPNAIAPQITWSWETGLGTKLQKLGISFIRKIEHVLF